MSDWEAGWYRIKGPEVGVRVGYHRDNDFPRLDSYKEKGYQVDLIVLVTQDEINNLIESAVSERLASLKSEEFTI